ncbi:hypothetical protein U370_03505 [Anaplasma marginale str. Dawn]|uniref:Uncharacterized protein n=1 Tax=Anaplasma marginale (strain Florida) TaxID=320483 RepID=B9KJ79_ANAMF|nr:hypothetical protein [Anaplasma marginale]ACM49541.1 Conserved hypothetical protein [Anaplasma marginale str. Florida]AGZ79037.1 hypothetical protein U128_03645 [Anaplasma marginale str. Gypsy Plains]AGZ79847.1 hypothetical protein U370_03505 [Anaplasma marginale str. Dawn]AXW84243.1 hypothetical protein CQZ76_03595 [Anaplasma marginale]KAB0451890.1 hypothetical protein FY192_03935 [Anaplasma marginale]
MPGCCSNSEPSGRSTEESGGGSHSRLKVLSRQVCESVLCGFSGASSFLIASASAIQLRIFLGVCHSSMEPGARRVHRGNMRNALAAMKASILPAAEMFVLVPLLCTLLHWFGSISLALCLLACWGAMFAVCLFVRVTGILKGCPRVESPMYGHGSPFPRMAPPQNVGAAHEHEDSMHSEPEPASNAGAIGASLLKSAVLAVLFIPFRAVTLVSTLVLMTVALLCSIPSFFHDVYDAVRRHVRHGSSERLGQDSQSTALFPRVTDIARKFCSLAKSALFDLAWIATLGITGVPSLMHGVTVEGLTSSPRVDVAAAELS